MTILMLILAARVGLKVIKKLIPAFLALAAALNFSGCAVVGITTGALIDGSREEYGLVKPGELDDVKEGREIKAKMTDGLTATGKFIAVAQADSAAYRSRYERAIQASDLRHFPHLGDSVTFQNSVNSEIIGRFAGFDKSFGVPSNLAYFYLRRSETGEEFSEKAKYLTFFNLPGGDSLAGETICKLIDQHRVPMRFRLLRIVSIKESRSG